MLKTQDSLKASLKRINFIYQNREITTKCIKDYKSISILNETIGPFKRGKNYKLKFFLAAPLIKHNILNISSKEKCDNMDVQRYAVNELNDQQLKVPEDRFFLNKVKEFKDFTEKEVNEGKKPKLMLDNYISYMSNIIDIRLLKLLKLAKTEITPNEERKLTESEQFIIRFISRLLKNWRKFFLENEN
jgi:hypothetical protein